MTAPSETNARTTQMMLDLVLEHAALLGYYDLTTTDLSAVYTDDCSLTAHAPLWGTKPGAETPVPITEVRKTLASMLAYATPERHDLHLAVHGGTNALALYFAVKAKLRVMPCFALMTVPLVFVVSFTSDDDDDSDNGDSLRISDIHEWPADDTESGRKLLTEGLAWPADTTFTKYDNFGALS